MTYRRLLKLSSLAFVVLALTLILQGKSRTVSAVTDNEILYLPMLSSSLCNFSNVRQPGDFLEYEPNDRFSQAIGPVLPGRAIWGCHSRTIDVDQQNQPDVDDLFYFGLNSASTIEVRLTNIEPGHNYDLALYEEAYEDGEKVKKLVDYSVNSGNVDETILIEIPKPKGIYYIQVHNAGETEGTRPYKLTAKYKIEETCKGLAIGQEVFPQLADESGQFPFYSENLAFHCDPVIDIVHNGLFALHMNYEAGEDEGYWGVATPEGHNAGKFSELCFWVFAKTVPQSFTVNLKDLDGVEKPSTVQSIIVANSWQQICMPLGHYEAEGVDIKRLESVNIHFNQATGDAEVWVDDFEYRGIPCDDHAVTREVFPQLADESGQYPFYSKHSAFQCETDFDIVHSGKFDLHLEYDAGIEDGYWGVATPNGFNAGDFSKVCLWVYANAIPQSFTLNLKDLEGNEKPSPIQSITDANSWQRICIPLSHYEANEDIDIRQLESVNIHFNQATEDIDIWVDDFEFDGTPCDHPAITEEVFPQLKNESGQFPFYSKHSGFQCEASYDIVRSGLLGLHAQYQAGGLDGYWGVATLNGFDASKFTEICYHAYAVEPLQSFTINLKDTNGVEKASAVQNIIIANEWIEKCIPLSEYKNNGVQLDRVENVNVHFSQATRDADILIDEFEYRPVSEHWACLVYKEKDYVGINTPVS